MSKQFCRKDSAIHGVGRLAKVLCDGLSLKRIGEALCIGTAGLFWWPYTGDRVGTHPYTGVHLHRYLLPEVRQFLSDLPVNHHVAASTQNQALSAILFLCQHVLR
jgi:hypothetical protein